MEAMSLGGMVMPSFLMKRKPWVEAAERTWSATSGEGEDMSITGMLVVLFVAGGDIFGGFSLLGFLLFSFRVKRVVLWRGVGR